MENSLHKYIEMAAQRPWIIVRVHESDWRNDSARFDYFRQGVDEAGIWKGLIC
jgi:hypothetical protein